MKLVLASNNQGKLAEIKELLAPFKLDIRPQSEFQVPEAVESGLSFVENAIIKARLASKHSGLPAIADDSGITVDALNGAPGVYSARYSGDNATDQENNSKLLNELAKVDDDDRGATFHCLLVLVRHENDPAPIIAHGEWRGSILREPRGVNGFGYDPLFWVAEKNCSSAELSREEKNQISHRGRAMSQMMELISQHGR